jgi:nitrate reductase NapAB chaperone NapD
MTASGLLVRVCPEHRAAVKRQLALLPGVTILSDPGDGSLHVEVEDKQAGLVWHGAQATVAAIAEWPLVLEALKI